MDAKVTLSFDQAVVERAKEFAQENNISLSRLTEFLLKRVTERPYQSLEDLPVSDWVMQVAEGKAEYKTKRSRKESRSDFYDSKK